MIDLTAYDRRDMYAATGRQLPTPDNMDDTARADVYRLGKRLVYEDFHQWYVNGAANEVLTAAAWRRGIDAIEIERKRREAAESRNGQTAKPLGTKATAKAIGG